MKYQLTLFLLFVSISYNFVNSTQVIYISNSNSATLNALGNVMILTVLPFATQYVNHLNVILLALNLKMLFAMLNAKNQNAKYYII